MHACNTRLCEHVNVSACLFVRAEKIIIYNHMVHYSIQILVY